jgi:hypothetical protein
MFPGPLLSLCIQRPAIPSLSSSRLAFTILEIGSYLSAKNSLEGPDAYDPRLDHCFELGRTIGIRPITNRLRAFEHIMKQIFAETRNAPLQSKSN